MDSHTVELMDSQTVEFRMNPSVIRSVEIC
jgi:hypothetical protein